MALTPKQEKFCRCIVSGMSGKDSYLTAYNCNSDTTAYQESYVLLQRDDIKEYISTLKKPIEQRAIDMAINEREKKRRWLWHMVETAESDSDRLRAMDILNKMDSEYININRNIQDDQTAISNLDTNTLRLIANDK